MLDTLRFADRLKHSGFESDQAEGMARALGDELTSQLEHVVKKPALDTAIGAVRSDLRAMDARLSAKFDALSARFDALSAKVDALSTQIKFMFAIQAMLLALGLIDTAPQILG